MMAGQLIHVTQPTRMGSEMLDLIKSAGPWAYVIAVGVVIVGIVLIVRYYDGW
jgi:hypothetical protein